MMKTEVHFSLGTDFVQTPNTLHVWLFDEHPDDVSSLLPDVISALKPEAGQAIHHGSEAFVWFSGLNAAQKLVRFSQELAGIVRQAPAWIQSIQVYIHCAQEPFIAGMDALLLGQYRYLGYKQKPEIKAPMPIRLFGLDQTFLSLAEERIKVCDSVALARNLVNEPYPMLNAVSLAQAAEQLALELGIRCEILNQARITSLKMGGILAVNQGSEIPPTLSILEYTPPGTENHDPVVLVGKGVVYDSGGLSLKPTPNSMDYMKSDMAGAAVVLGTIKAAVLNRLPVRLVGIIPSSDNMPGPKSYVPGEVITMFNGTTVEVMNTDAEGRLLLADALAYAAKYKPAMVMDFATLTGAAMRAIGSYGAVAMGNLSESHKSLMKQAAIDSGERWVEFPLWDDYAEEIKSEIADLKNLGSDNAGAITAGKFLEHFTSYPWMHFDIAGPAYLHKSKGLFSYGGTGFGVRLSYEFLKLYSKQA